MAFGACDDDTALPVALDARTVGDELCAAGCATDAGIDASDEGIDPTDAGIDASDAGIDPTIPSPQHEPNAGTGHDAGSDCTLGSTSACTADEGCSGTQHCLRPGTWGECSCVPVPRPNLVGDRCASDLDCGPELQCWSADQPLSGIEGGPAGGYCTRPCVRYTDCPEDAACHSIADVTDDTSQLSQRLCLLRCTNESNPPVLEHNCDGRSDLACWTYPALERRDQSNEIDGGLCLPLCGSDADCPGRYCTPGRYLSLCTDQPPPSMPPIGAACSTDADCGPGGACQFWGLTQARACTQLCSWDGASSCGYGPEVPESEREYLCLGMYSWVIEYLGDPPSRGFESGPSMTSTCMQACEQDSDCRQASAYTCGALPYGYSYGGPERTACVGPGFYGTQPVDAGVPDGG